MGKEEELARGYVEKHRMKNKKKKMSKRKNIITERVMVKKHGSILRQIQWKKRRLVSDVC